MMRVCVESPCRGGSVPDWVPQRLRPFVERYVRAVNHEYARMCVLDSLRRGEAPYASHVMFDLSMVLDDARADDRTIGMRVGEVWQETAELVAVYTDRGISDGMRRAVARAKSRGQRVEHRRLYE